MSTKHKKHIVKNNVTKKTNRGGGLDSNLVNSVNLLHKLKPIWKSDVTHTTNEILNPDCTKFSFLKNPVFKKMVDVYLDAELKHYVLENNINIKPDSICITSVTIKRKYSDILLIAHFGKGNKFVEHIYVYRPRKRTLSRYWDVSCLYGMKLDDDDLRKMKIDELIQKNHKVVMTNEESKKVNRTYAILDKKYKNKNMNDEETNDEYDNWYHGQKPDTTCPDDIVNLKKNLKSLELNNYYVRMWAKEYWNKQIKGQYDDEEENDYNKVSKTTHFDENQYIVRKMNRRTMKVFNLLLNKNCGDKNLIGHYILRELCNLLITDLSEHSSDTNMYDTTFSHNTIKSENHEHLFI